jgi:replicative DNA helicase
MAADDWDPHSERHYYILVDGLFKLGDSKLYPIGDIPYVAVHTEVCRVMNDDPILRDAQFLIKDIVGRPTDPVPCNGLLYHAYKGVDEDDLSTPYGITLLKKFLHERQVFDRVRRVIDGAGGRNVIGFEAVLAKAQETAAAIEVIGHTGAASLAETLPALLTWLETTHGKVMLGLETGLIDLDERTLGLRGVTVLGAMPGSGKTSLAVQIAAGVARRHPNDAAVVFVSLDMDAIEIKARILSHLAELDWATLRRGSPEYRGQPTGPYFNAADYAKLEAASAELNGEVGRRISVLGRHDLHGDLDAARLAALLAETKAAVGATRGLLILDYIQLIEPPAAVQKLGDLAADKHRIMIMQDVVARTRSSANPEGDAVLAISEVRKPPDAKQGWGAQPADLMGAARTAYAADAVILYRRMTPTEVKKTYGLGAASKELVAQHLAQLDEAGVTPMIVSLAKGRDGMRRGEWALEFAYRISTWRRPPITPAPSATGGMYAGADDDDDDDDDEDGQDGLPVCQQAQIGDASPNGHLLDPDGLDGPQAARARILAALAAVPDGETATALTKAAKLAAGPARKILEELVAEGWAVAVPVTKPHARGGKSAKTHPGYRLAGVNGQSADGSPTITPTTTAITPTTAAITPTTETITPTTTAITPTTITPTTATITPTKPGTPATCQG